MAYLARNMLASYKKVFLKFFIGVYNTSSGCFALQENKPSYVKLFYREHLHRLMFCLIKELNQMERAKEARADLPLRKVLEMKLSMPFRRSKVMIPQHLPQSRAQRMTRHLPPLGM